MNTPEKEFVPYDASIDMKLLGFDEPCFKMSEHRKACEEQLKPEGCQLHNLHCGYPDCTIDQSITPIPLPTFSQSFRFFREKYGYLSYIDMDNYSFYRYTIYKGKGISEAPFDTYEEAENACLTKLIEIVESKPNC